MKFMFSGALLRFAGFAKEIEVSEPEFELALKSLLAQKPDLAPVLLDGKGNVRGSHQMFLNGESMERRYWTDAQARRELTVLPGDSVYFLTAIAGG